MFVPMPSSTDPMQYFTYTEAPDLPVAPVQQPTDGTFSFVPVVTGEFYRPTREARAAGMEIIIEDSEDGVGTEQVRRVKPSAILTARKGVIKTAREVSGGQGRVSGLGAGRVRVYDDLVVLRIGLIGRMGLPQASGNGFSDVGISFMLFPAICVPRSRTATQPSDSFQKATRRMNTTTR